MVRNEKSGFFTLYSKHITNGCEKNDEYIPSDGVPKPTNIIVSELVKAYNTKSNSALQDILTDWGKENAYKPVSVLSHKTEKDIYEIFQIFYRPFDISSLGDHEWTEMYSGVKYAIVQNKIFYNFSYGKEEWTEQRDSLIDFKPQVSFSGKKVLYLTDNYHEAIYSFLRLEYNPL